MKKLSTTVQLLLMLTFLVLWQAEAYAAPVITHVSDGQEVTLTQLMADAERSDLIMIGEVHDNKGHHEIQLAVIRSLWAKKLPLAIGVEMMQTDSQKDLNDWTDGKISERDFLTVFADNWTYHWQLYRDIFIFARDNKIPMVALNIPKEVAKKVSRGGYKSLTAEEMKNLPAGTSCDLNNPHTAFLKKSFQEVFKHVTNGRVFDYFCEAQTLRNSGMAMNIGQYAKKHPERKIIALAGIWHSVRNAIPEQLARNGSKLASTVILPEIPELQRDNATVAEADYMVGLSPS